MQLALIAAVAADGAIGRKGAMPWHLPEDLAHFRRVTHGSPVVMGRRTWESLPPRFRPLPGRRNVVLTREAGWQAAGAEGASSLGDALSLLGGHERAFVIGGGELYSLALPLAQTLVLTEIDTLVPDADTHFPAWDRSAFAETARTAGIHRSEDGTELRFAFVTYQRQPITR